jgi:hypothetical protein
LGVMLPSFESKIIVSMCTSQTNTITIELDSARPYLQTRVLAPFWPDYGWPGHGRPARPRRYTLANAPYVSWPCRFSAFAVPCPGNYASSKAGDAEESTCCRVPKVFAKGLWIEVFS